MKQDEHRPMMVRRFPDLVDRVEYWSVHDIDIVPPPMGIAQAEERLLALLQGLRQDPG